MKGIKSNEMQKKISIDDIIGVVYGYYTRYMELKPLSDDAFTRTRAGNLTICIDLDDIFMKIDKQIKDIVKIPIGVECAITSSIINMCAHYRNFFINTYGVETYFFLIGSSTSMYVEDKICAEYKHPVPTSANTNAIKATVINVLSQLVPYIPDVYLLNAFYDFNAGVINAVNSTINNKNIPCMAISKDPCSFILGTYGIYVLRPKKYNGADTSYIVLPEMSLVEYASYYTGRKPSTPVALLAGLHETHLYAALAGCKSRCLNKISSGAVGMYKCFIKDKALSNVPFISESDITILVAGYCHCSDADAYRIVERFKVLDCNNTSYIQYSTGDYGNGLVFANLYDPERVKKLNETSFANYPLDLNAL